MPSYLLALDQGTTSSRAILFDGMGKRIATDQKEFTQHYPQPGWVEHDANEIWATQLAVARGALRKASLQPGDVAAIGITNQRETTVLWDRATGDPIYHAIVWQCRRTAPMCDALRQAGHADLFRQKTGLVVDAYFSGTKLAWLLDNVPDARRRAEAGELAFGTIDCYLIWKLTGGRVHATDVSNASRTLMFNIHALDWDNDLLRILNVPRAVLPEVKPSSAIYGHTASDVLGAGIPIGGAAGDQQAATFGQACFAPGMAKNTYGTGCFMLLNTGGQPVASDSGLLTTIAWGMDGETIYALEGSVFITGAAVQWLRDGLGIIASAPEIEELAEGVPDTGGVTFVPAFVGLGAPYWDPYARGLIIGLTRGTTRAHLARATLEAVCFQTRDVLNAMQRDSGIVIETLRIDGGMVVNNLLCQLQADLLGIRVERPRVVETTALGAAYLAGLAVGVWDDLGQIAAQWALDRTFDPALDAQARDAAYINWQRAVERARAWITPES
jgi:glycerol kinase